MQPRESQPLQTTPNRSTLKTQPNTPTRHTHARAAGFPTRRPLLCTLSPHPTCNKPHTRAAALRTQQPHPGKIPWDWSGAHTRPAAHWPLRLISGTLLVGTFSLLARRRRALYQKRLEWAGLPARVRAEEANCREPGAARAPP